MHREITYIQHSSVVLQNTSGTDLHRVLAAAGAVLALDAVHGMHMHMALFGMSGCQLSEPVSCSCCSRADEALWPVVSAYTSCGKQPCMLLERHTRAASCC